MFFIRPITHGDLPLVLALSERTGTGLTTLPADRDRLLQRIERSLASFEGAAAKANACYMFVLVEGANGADERVVGISAIESAVGLNEPWYNYHVGTLVHASRALNVYTVSPTLFLSNDHTGHTELCSLFLDQRYRIGKNGPLLAKCRLLFIAEFTDLFSSKVIAELRGRLEADGSSPFWEGLGRHFFAMEYSTADYLTGIGQKSFIAELMPKHPVYVNLLPQSARDAIGTVHADTAPARAMLEQEGFRYEGYVDIFDAGPTVECTRENIDAVRRSSVMTCTLGEEDPVPDSLTDDILWLVCDRKFRRVSRVGHGGAGASRPISVAAPRRRSARRHGRRQRACRAACAVRPMSAAAPAQDASSAPLGTAEQLTPQGLGAQTNFDGLPGPTHNYSGLAHGNLAAERNARSRFRESAEAALQGLAKMRALASRGFRAGAAAARDATPCTRCGARVCGPTITT